VPPRHWTQGKDNQTYDAHVTGMHASRGASSQPGNSQAVGNHSHTSSVQVSLSKEPPTMRNPLEHQHRQVRHEMRQQLSQTDAPVLFSEWMRRKHEKGQSFAIAARAVVERKVGKNQLDLQTGYIPEGPLVETVRSLQEETMQRIQRESAAHSAASRKRRLAGDASVGGAHMGRGRNRKGGGTRAANRGRSRSKNQVKGDLSLASGAGDSHSDAVRDEAEAEAIPSTARGSETRGSSISSTRTGVIPRRRMCPFTKQVMNLLTAAPDETLRLPAFMRKLPSAKRARRRGQTESVAARAALGNLQT